MRQVFKRITECTKVYFFNLFYCVSTEISRGQKKEEKGNKEEDEKDCSVLTTQKVRANILLDKRTDLSIKKSTNQVLSKNHVRNREMFIFTFIKHYTFHNIQ